MNRRELIQSALGVLGAFNLGFGIGRRLQSPVCGAVIGKPLSAVLDTTIGLQFYELPNSTKYMGRYAQYPIETQVRVEYEHGTEIWSCYNLSDAAIGAFSMKSFLNSKIKVKPGPCGTRVMFGGTEFALALLSIRDGVSPEVHQSMADVLQSV